MLCGPWLLCPWLCYLLGLGALFQIPEQLALNMIGLYPGIQPISQSHTVLGHLSIIQFLNDRPYLPDVSPLSCRKPGEHTLPLCSRSLLGSVYCITNHNALSWFVSPTRSRTCRLQKPAYCPECSKPPINVCWLKNRIKQQWCSLDFKYGIP